MLLYYLAKQIEERNRLARTIRESGGDAGDVGKLLDEKNEIDLRLRAQAEEWREAMQAMPQMDSFHDDLSGDFLH